MLIPHTSSHIHFFSFCLPHIIFIKVRLEAKLGIFLTGDSFTLVILKANYSPLLFNSGYMRRQTYGVSIRFCHLINAINLDVPWFFKKIFWAQFAESTQFDTRDFRWEENICKWSCDQGIQIYFFMYSIEALTILFGNTRSDLIPEILHKKSITT